METEIKGLVVGGTHSGSGKSTLTIGLLAALKRRGLTVAPFKVGPDFIDPGHHSAIAGRASRNLDGWMLDRNTNCAIFQAGADHADLALIEGVMGLFDGYDGRTEAGSTAQMAKWLQMPVLLVVDARSMARSAAAVVQGFENFDPELEFAGVVFNNLGSPRHLQYLKDALADHVRMPFLGGLYRDDQIRIPERHLGLVTSEDHPIDQTVENRLAEKIESGLEMDRLLERLGRMPRETRSGAFQQSTSEPGARIGVARDAAFCFYYEHNFELMQACGARIVPFSPIRDRHLPEALDGLYLGGGYPELYADQLSANQTLRNDIQACSREGMPIYAECGGFMYLCRYLNNLEGQRFEMAGCFPFSTRMLPRLKTLGYREIRLKHECVLGASGQTIRGHEFHYSEIIDADADVDTVYEVASRIASPNVCEGYLIRNTLGSYIHLHFGSRPDSARQFVDACRQFKEQRTLAP